MNHLRTFLDLMLLAWTVVFAVDLSGFREWVLSTASRVLGGPVRSLKPLTCSLCLTWWAGIVYLLVSGRFTIAGVALAGVAAVLAQPLAALAGALLDIINKFINKIQ